MKLALWAGLSLVLGTAILLWQRVRQREGPLLQHFAIQTAAWGAVDLAIVWWGASRLELRDLAGATSLDRFLWLNIGLDIGYVLVGITLALCGWRLGKRLGLVGAGLGVIVQGLALTVLDLQLSVAIVR